MREQGHEMQQVTIRETVRAWGYETTTFEVPIDLDEIKAAIIESEDYEPEALDEITTDDLIEYLNDHYVPVHSSLDLKEITDRDDAVIE